MADSNGIETESDGSDGYEEELTSRAPTEEDIISLCRELNRLGAKYVLIGGWAIITTGYARSTGDIDLLIDTSLENEAKVFAALETLPDKAVLELEAGDVEKFSVVRIGDEILVDLMRAACGIRFEEASTEVVVRELDGVKIPFASPSLLWKTKKPTHREKDLGDLVFLREWFRQRGKEPPEM